MRLRNPRGATWPRRILLLAASFVLAATGWFLLGESESQTLAAVPPSSVLARVNGVDITEDAVAGIAAEELDELARRRHQVMVEATRGEVRRRLVAAEAAARGMTPEELLAVEAPPGDGDRYEALIARLEERYGVEYLIEPSGVEVAAAGTADAGSGGQLRR